MKVYQVSSVDYHSASLDAMCFAGLMVIISFDVVAQIVCRRGKGNNYITSHGHGLIVDQ